MRDVFVEIHDFGYGPACGFLDATASFSDEFNWHVLASGNAARYLARARPEAEIIPFNGYDPENWKRLSSLIPQGSPLLSLSNPGFASYAAGQGFRVALIDQLDWMWSANPVDIDLVELHLIQHYFGASSNKQRPAKALEVRPIVTPALPQRNGSKVLDMIVIGLGGMAIAGNPEAGDAYARWLLRQVSNALDQTGFSIVIVGGSPNLVSIVRSAGLNGATVVNGMSRLEYLSLLNRSSFQILTPGLASIYESEALGLSPLFLPGVNKSMLLQLQSLVNAGYPQAVSWPWMKEVRSALQSLPAGDALALITGKIKSSMADEDNSGRILQAAILDYVEGETRHRIPVDIDKGMPEASVLLRQALSRMVSTSQRPASPDRLAVAQLD
ncbi:hypothetical protein ELG72_37180 [Rhizobium leguminosarum]|uniref:hypothetical protein n=1 Tax=Rhizobium TaxID=379 RepID=UPI00102F4A0E|nr:hypothetical protein [Rhizobium leguminosarum]TBF87483.1 hypothetical protein ELG82_37920 [Rhizobium leguminosarum]TBG06959.1 hypothetical protein ELG80_37695 [Rhizobium leguminosarum]TBG07830.1 hypothetical protein ELG81_37080 [Rhizobium leguminosarum]TBG29996.1 hypothetical protein ELG75_37765 [Rhizobium leguminosarum]TBG50129.1 hypothetical protein ELG72_37180 [Rhizobium leguminosarum]